ncbi:neutral zinc metallopeptidase [Methylocystis sp. L43]|jgi:predicted metalloprotease|uniref:KPN_02809 family neutral zinc metallopeptidase n=1 Tax=unclassified Methylocystis TaxID=2625913 RepID=UPI0018C28FF5|nr:MULTISPECIES: neutral zinc metallopeptidase [unclassified Methylocystis]MBG0797325.1 neutral zinc metallopeptidase [Methylocystis sp. L43]MBG0807822.1 neutral zinc metallopeptidase [Methylocystis sp. H15]
MKWEDLQSSENIEDRRGGGSMMGGGPRVGAGGIGLGTMVILGLIGWALGVNPAILIGGAQMINNMRQEREVALPRQEAPRQSAPTDQLGRFVAKVVGSNEQVWSRVLPEQKGVRFQPPRLVLFNGYTQSRCGAAQSAMGPFYCPLDQRIYLDTSFFRDMQRRFGGGGDFAYAYVISHEMGHHVQNLLGILPKIQRAQQLAGSRSEANALSVRAELMADCLAGVWANNANKQKPILEEGDIEQAVASAQAIGDDRQQKATRGYVVPDSFTHGSAAQRAQWLLKGLRTGSIDACDTFAR